MSFTVLVADDDFDNRAILKHALEAAGWMVVEAVNGLDAVEVAGRGSRGRGPHLPRHVDAGLKRLGGGRTHPAQRRLPVIILTAMGEAESQALALELGADDHLVKPCDPRLLRARVKALLRRRAAGV